ncbi:MAG: hypothetical protein ACRD3T_13425 [Terriglobia bacterium]
MRQPKQSTGATPGAIRKGSPPPFAARRKAGGKPDVCHDVDEATPDVQEKVRKLLVNGATFEDTVATLAESGTAAVTVRAVENYYRGHVDIQEERIKRQVGTADKLKKALKDPNSAQARLAEAVLLTGLMGVHDKTEATGVQNAIKVQSEQDRHRVNWALAKLRIRKMQAESQMLRVRLKHELAKINRLKLAIERFQNALQNAGGGQRVKPETIQRIQEIYGLLADSNPPTEEHAPATEA